MKYIEGPGILIVKNRPLLADDNPMQSFSITIDEQYITELIAAKFGIPIEPRKEN